MRRRFAATAYVFWGRHGAHHSGVTSYQSYQSYQSYRSYKKDIWFWAKVLTWKANTPDL